MSGLNAQNVIGVLLLVALLVALFETLRHDVDRREYERHRRQRRLQQLAQPPAPRKLIVGARVRMLCAYPEVKVEVGQCGRVRRVHYADDIEYIVKMDGGAVISIYEGEEWQLEIV